MVSSLISSNRQDPHRMLQELATELQGKGQIKTNYDVDSKSSTTGVKAAMVRFERMSVVDKLLARLGIGSARQKQEAAFNWIGKLVNYSELEHGDKLLANIRTKMHVSGELRGNDVADCITAFLDRTDRAETYKDGLVMPSSTRSMNLMKVSPLRVHADHAIVRFVTVGKAVRDKQSALPIESLAPKLDAMMDEIMKKTKDDYSSVVTEDDIKNAFEIEHPNLASKNTTVLMDFNPSENTAFSETLKVRQLQGMYRSTLAGKEGDVVLEPFPDTLTQNGESKIRYGYHDEHLKAMLLAVDEAIQNASRDKKSLRVTIATSDQQLFDRIQKMDRELQSEKSMNPDGS